MELEIGARDLIYSTSNLFAWQLSNGREAEFALSRGLSRPGSRQ
jgi:hypothetical protein